MTALATNILTLDIEDWCQSSPEVFNGTGIPPRSAPTMRAVTNTRRLLEILREYKARATCFILGSLAEAYPSLISEILDSGHEIASHGFHHFPVHHLNPDEFRADVARSLESLGRIAGGPVRGYRAPYFSITSGTRWALPILAELGLEYDSSVFPLHRRYYRIPGWAGSQDAARYPVALKFGNRRLLELPPTTVRILGQNLPFAGGAFLGLLPSKLFTRAIRRRNRAGHPGILYLHPHDLDAQGLGRSAPGATLRKRLWQWGLSAGRSGNEDKLRQLLSEFSFTSIRKWLDAGAGHPLPEQGAYRFDVPAEKLR